MVGHSCIVSVSCHICPVSFQSAPCASDKQIALEIVETRTILTIESYVESLKGSHEVVVEQQIYDELVCTQIQ